MEKRSLFTILLCLGYFMVSLGNPSEKNNHKAENAFQFTVYSSENMSDVEIIEEHFLGEAITAKWNLFNKRFTQKYEVSVGFSGSTVEIIKPAVYNAVLKINSYIRKQFRKELMPQDEAIRILSHTLDCALAVQSEYDTGDFEKALITVRKPKDLICFFEKVDIRHL